VDKLEKQSMEISRHFDTLMIHIAQMQQNTVDELQDLNKQEANVIFFLGERGASIMRELAENLRLHVSTMTGIVDKLIEKGFVNRERSDEDRRIVRVSLTEQGARAHHQEGAKRQQMSRIILNSLDEEEREQLLSLFGKISAEIEKTFVR
jgi:DNA-binding MarR family transcriptional regulator